MTQGPSDGNLPQGRVRRSGPTAASPAAATQPEPGPARSKKPETPKDDAEAIWRDPDGPKGRILPARTEPREIETFRDPATEMVVLDDADEIRKARRANPVARIALTAGGILLGLAVGLAAFTLIRDLWALNPIIGWAALAVLGVLVIAVTILLGREYLALRRLRVLDDLRDQADRARRKNLSREARDVARELAVVYGERPELTGSLADLDRVSRNALDGSDIIEHAERKLIAPLDLQAKAIIGAAARRVELVTAISPRAFVDMTFVAFQSVKLAGDIARLYGARPGMFGTMRLMGEVMSHLAVTGGLVLTDGIIEQVLGQELTAKLSARLGEGIVNGVMTVRVGIAAMRIVRPLPFHVQRAPLVRDYLPELLNLLKKNAV